MWGRATDHHGTSDSCMREIKFRAWDINEKKMFFASELRWGTNGEFLGAGDTWFTREGLAPAEKWSFDVMQYTGLKDRNSKDIYEGDILKLLIVVSKAFVPDYTIEENITVEFVDGAFNFTKSIERGSAKIKTYEIIGNIYENGELL